MAKIPDGAIVSIKAFLSISSSKDSLRDIEGGDDGREDEGDQDLSEALSS